MPENLQVTNAAVEGSGGLRQTLEAAYAKVMGRYKPPVREFDPTAGMSNAEKALAGIGAGFVSASDMVRQFLPESVGGISQAQLEERERLNAPLMDTQAGYIGGIVGENAPFAAVPIPALGTKGAGRAVAERLAALLRR